MQDDVVIGLFVTEIVQMQQTPAQAAQLQAAMAQVWQKSLPLLRERVGTLEQALAAIQTDELTPELRSNAALEAHRLAGLLGTFGYPDGTDAARMFEIVFDSDAILKPGLAETLAPALVTLRSIMQQ
jgi:HPt (histidine-containing phosphotransfer) domain-containing protein